jgi:hypothetical protein
VQEHELLELEVALIMRSMKVLTGGMQRKKLA